MQSLGKEQQSHKALYKGSDTTDAAEMASLLSLSPCSTFARKPELALGARMQRGMRGRLHVTASGKRYR